jgi:hypothetical protein
MMTLQGLVIEIGNQEIQTKPAQWITLRNVTDNSNDWEIGGNQPWISMGYRRGTFFSGVNVNIICSIYNSKFPSYYI